MSRLNILDLVPQGIVALPVGQSLLLRVFFVGLATSWITVLQNSSVCTGWQWGLVQRVVLSRAWPYRILGVWPRPPDLILVKRLSWENVTIDSSPVPIRKTERFCSGQIAILAVGRTDPLSNELNVLPQFGLSRVSSGTSRDTIGATYLE